MQQPLDYDVEQVHSMSSVNHDKVCFEWNLSGAVLGPCAAAPFQGVSKILSETSFRCSVTFFFCHELPYLTLSDHYERV